MISRSSGWRFLFAATAFLLAAGCANTNFVYKPGAPAASGPKLPMKVAVLPFKDGTEDFTKRGGIFSHNTWNLAKTGVTDRFSALPSVLWAKFFADDLSSSSVFQAVRFIYSPSELADEEFFIEGVLEKAYYNGGMIRPNEFAFGLRAIRRTDNRLVWEKEVTRVWKNMRTYDEGCGISAKCMVDKDHAEKNLVMQDMFAEARLDLVRALAATPGKKPDTSGHESTDEVIKRILGKP
jgi:hypothetical protein